jgi:ubiquinol-cytochrome c reductase cytochrome c subunit
VGGGNWLVMAPLVVVASAVGLALSSTAGASARSVAATDSRDVRKIFLSDCAVCHGANGRGTERGPSLIGVGRASVDYQLSTGRMPLVAVGRSNDQPGTPLQPLPNSAALNDDIVARRHDPAYPPETIAPLVDYVAGIIGGGGPTIPRVGKGDLAEGGALFRQQCAACHAWAGDGGALLRIEAPALHSSTPTQIAEAIRVGPGQMPVFGTAALTDKQMSSVVAYVRYLDHPDDRGGQPFWHLGPFAEGAIALMALAVLLVFTRWIGERG